MSSVERRPKVGVVLGSGGIKTFSAIALFEFLDEMDIDIDLLIGCSGGGLAAAARGAGYNPAQMRNLIGKFVDRSVFSSVDYRTILGLARLPFGRFDKGAAILKADRIRQSYQDVFKDLELEDLRPTTLLQATDVLTGEGVVLSHGSVVDAICATTSAFPMLPPVCIEGRWLVDGAFSSSLPVMEAVKRNMDVIIAVAFRHRFAEEPSDFLDYFTTFFGRPYVLEEREMALAIDLHHHEIVIVDVHFDRIIHMWDMDEIPFILETGQKTVDRKKRAILSAIESFSVKQNE
jgi:NTE family protein